MSGRPGSPPSQDQLLRQPTELLRRPEALLKQTNELVHHPEEDDADEIIELLPEMPLFG